MTHIEIASHCWRYSRLLTYQLSSLALHPPRCVQVTMTVFYAPEDQRTAEVLGYFARRQIANVCWRWWPLDRPRLLRRAIGRNLAALATEAEWIWFADCDMYFGEGSLDALTGLSECDSPIVFPRNVLIHKEHRLGDLAIEAVREPGIVGIRSKDFAPIQYNRAIGGVQIARGYYVRQAGYCKDTCFQQPTESAMWLNTRCDVLFRKIAGTSGLPVDIPNVYRLRHSRRGDQTPRLEL